MPSYAAFVLAEAARTPAIEPRRLDAAQLETTLVEMAESSSTIPLLPDDALSRQSLYEDHD